MKGKLELGYNSKRREIMCAINDIFEGEFIQYDKGEPVPPLSDKTSLYHLNYYHFYYL